MPLLVVFLFPMLVQPLRFLLFWNFLSTAACVRETAAAGDTGIVSFKDKYSFRIEMHFSRSLFLLSICVISHAASTVFQFFCTAGTNVWAASEEMLFCSSTYFADRYWRPRKTRLSSTKVSGDFSFRGFGGSWAHQSLCGSGLKWFVQELSESVLEQRTEPTSLLSQANAFPSKSTFLNHVFPYFPCQSVSIHTLKKNVYL